jgi:hypothetical protein
MDVSAGPFGNSAVNDQSGIIPDINSLLSDKNPLRSLRARLPSAPGDSEAQYDGE